MDAVQQARLFTDSKHFVDMPLRHSYTAAVMHFTQLETVNVSLDSLKAYTVAHHHEPGSDLVPCVPVDFQPSPDGFLKDLSHSKLREWALKVHALWTILCRKVGDEVRDEPDNHTLLPLPNTVFVPGDRFRETYYWDSYWIIRGLLVSGMTQSATSLVMNLCSMLDAYGFVPNGSRSYYLNRSQPPLLSAMVRDVWATTGSLDLLRVALPLLVREHHYWTSGSKLVVLQGADGQRHTLSRYHADWYQPRPESYREDVELAHGLDSAASAQLYCDIATAAESGWDFSSRWFAEPHDMRTIRTTRVVPADLNAFLAQMEDNIALFARELGDVAAAAEFSSAAGSRRTAIQACQWDAAAGCWCDVVLTDREEDTGVWVGWQRNTAPMASNWVPLACGICEPGSEQAQAAVASFAGSGLNLPAGVATTLAATGQQWDFPNTWPPLQHLLVEGLRSSAVPQGAELAKELALKWIQTCYVAYQKTGQMHEKYNAVLVGGVGNGGEYVPQTGFGWSNGVVLDLLAQYAEECGTLKLIE